MTRYLLGFVAWSIAVLVSLCSAQTAQDDQTDDRTGVHVGGRIEGHVWDRATRTPLAGAVIVLGNRRSGTVSDEAGHFTFHVDPGPVTLEITLIGYEPWRSDTLTVIAGTSLRLDIRLATDVIELREIIVTPGRFTIMGDATGSHQALSEEEIQSIPQFGEDIFRSVTRLPGVTGSDFSAKFIVRGGEQDEVLVRLDGVELFEPFHLKDINGGALSIIDVNLIEGIDLLTGGFPAEYGDRMSGVFDVRSRCAKPGQRHAAVGLSMMNARVLLEGADQNRSWLVSARRGYLDIVLALMGEDDTIDPAYSDLFAKYTHALSDRHQMQVSLLRSQDEFDLIEDDQEARTGYGNTYAWLSLTSTLSPSLVGRTTVSAGRVTDDRVGVGYFDDGSDLDFVIRDERDFDVWSLRQDWSLEAGRDHFLKWGFDLRRLQGSYDYLSSQRIFGRDAAGVLTTVQDTTAVDLELTRGAISVYGADRLRLSRRWTAELGLRYDHAGHTGDDLLSPRLNLVYNLDKHTSVRAAWGLFHQTQAIHQLEIQDGERRFHDAERAEHRVLGFEHLREDGIHLRVEVYDKLISSRRPAYRNWRDDIQVFSELERDRVRLDMDDTQARGLEMYLKRDTGGRFTWWLSYALAEVRDDIRSFGVGTTTFPFDDEIPGRYDQRHTFYADANFRPNARWRLNLAWQYRTGWPYTQQFLRLGTAADGSLYFFDKLGELNGATYPAFHRLDLRLNRAFKVGGGRLHAFLQVTNLYNNGNVSSFEYLIDCGGSQDPADCHYHREPEFWFRLLPSLGLDWSWDLR